MIEFIGIWILVAALGVTLAAPLGPINLEMIKHALNRSITHKLAWLSSVFIGIGATTGDFIIASMALTIGGKFLIDVFSNLLVKLLLLSLNIIILGYLGFSTFLEDPKIIDELAEGVLIANSDPLKSSIQHLVDRYVTGISIVITSPWSYLWWISAGTIILFSDFNAPDLLSRITIVLMFLSGIFLWILGFSTMLAIIGRLPNLRLLNWITKGSALVLLAFAALIGIEALETLLELYRL